MSEDESGPLDPLTAEIIQLTGWPGDPKQLSDVLRLVDRYRTLRPPITADEIQGARDVIEAMVALRVQANPPAGRGDWRTEWWRARALLLASLYFTLTAAAEFEFKSDLLTKLEAHLVVALALWGYFYERNKRR